MMYKVEFEPDGLAHTLPAYAVSEDGLPGHGVRTHASGWTICGDVHEDYFLWVNDFEAGHSYYGRVWGDFEHAVYATSQEAYRHFVMHHPPIRWDYGDI